MAFHGKKQGNRRCPGRTGKKRLKHDAFVNEKRRLYMRLLCISLVALGACIMSFSIFLYYKSLIDLKNQMKAKKLFGNLIYAACLIMMGFFLIGYIIIM